MRQAIQTVILLLFLMVLSSVICVICSSTNTPRKPAVVNAAAIVSFGSIVGKVAKFTLEAAAEDVNSSPDVLDGVQLNLTIHDTYSNGFRGIAEGLNSMGKDTVAVIGPQSSVVARVLSFVATDLHVPLLSFGATDPTISRVQFPFFVRTTRSDLFQMAAIADIVNHFEWREVIAIYVDDDHGRNGIDALGNKLSHQRCRISYKAPLSPYATRSEITDALVKVALAESRIIVLQAYPGSGLKILSVARHLGMMSTGYVWIATDWLSTVLDTDGPLPSDVMDDIQGVLTLRMYLPNSEPKRRLITRLSNLAKLEKTNSSFVGLNVYSLYAYDTVWLLAHAVDAFLRQRGNITFSKDSRLSGVSGGKLHLDAMNIFDGGNHLLNNVLQVNMTGVTGPIKFTSDGDIVDPVYEVINVIGTGHRKIGYWFNHSGLSVQPPENFCAKQSNHFNSSQKLFGIVWPGQTTQKPRGWVFPNSGRHLRIGVPKRISYREFVAQKEGTDIFTGYCIEVFTAALNLLPYAVPYKFYPFGDGHHNPDETELVNLIAAGVYDAAVGDIAMITNRTLAADFTQPYIESGLVVAAPIRKMNSNDLGFLRPFTPMMWCVTAIFFLAVGTVIWILEHKRNDDFRGPPRRQLVTILWFSFSTWFLAHRENTVSSLGRAVLLIWLFVVLIINSSYTASLTSNLTVQQLYSPIKGIESLRLSSDPIGYQQGSYTRYYLVNELNIDPSRLVPLTSPEQVAKALKDGPKKGGVAAVVDERAYIELFLSARCEFSIVGQEFTKNGWGFAFPHNSPLAVDMSTAILKLSEDGDLQRIHDKWLMRRTPCSLQGAKLEVDKLQLKSFWGLYAIFGSACLLALLVYFFKIMHKFSQHHPEKIEPSGRSSKSGCLQTFLSFVDEKEIKEEGRSKRRLTERAFNSSRSVGEVDSTQSSIGRHSGYTSNDSLSSRYEQP